MIAPFRTGITQSDKKLVSQRSKFLKKMEFDTRMNAAQISIKLAAMKFHILVPNLFWPDATFRIEALPHLETLLAKGERVMSPGCGLEEWLCKAFLVRKQEDWPVAPLTLEKGAEDLDYWLRADPVNLQVRRDHLTLLGPEALSVSDREAGLVIDALNRHFETDGLLFVAENPEAWLVRPPSPPHVSTTPLCDAIGRDIDPYLPKGVDAMRWNQIANEIQMLLHDHPVNEEREREGKFPVNSLWFWGGGMAPDVRQSPFSSISSDNLIARGLSKQTDTPFRPVPVNAKEWLSGLQGEGEHLVILEDLRFPSRYGDANEWDSRLRRIESEWFEPLHLAVQEGSTLTLTNCESGLSFGTGRLDLWKFWKRNRPVLDYLK